MFDLTEKETEVLGHLCSGLDKHEIAAVLDISSRTVEVHIYRIRKKMGVRNNHHAVAKALVLGLVPTPDMDA